MLDHTKDNFKKFNNVILCLKKNNFVREKKYLIIQFQA